MTVLNDRTQGGSSLLEGTVEVLVYRRIVRTGAGSSFTIDERGVDGNGRGATGPRDHHFFLDKQKIMICDKRPLNVYRYQVKEGLVAGKADKNAGYALNLGGKWCP
ncbi:unnamed protein product, partial [Oppiella nova]